MLYSLECDGTAILISDWIRIWKEVIVFIYLFFGNLTIIFICIAYGRTM